jgi:bacterioferritin (cytochrome b1)
MDKDPLDVDTALERLQRALPLQLRSANAYALAAGSIVGYEYASLSELLFGAAARDLEDARRLAEKITTLGGELCDAVPGFEVSSDPEGTIERLIDTESETIEALQDVIPSTGHDGPSEALEHRLEHIIMRKQEVVDALMRVRRAPQRRG